MPTTPRLPFDEDRGDQVAAPATAALPDARDRADAVDPRLNVVLEASAGTGKTRVLVDRYVNLVRAGVEPKHILAITFTRKAAAEMRERILQTLRRTAEEGGIDERRWRSLRERLGEVGISTIDAFCLSLLREFPLEAGLDPGFGMADETEALRLTDEALDRALRVCRAVARQDESVALVFAELGELQLRRGLAALLDRRLVAGPILDRAVRPTPRELTPTRVAVAMRSRLAATLGGVEGGLARFLATGPVRHPRYRLLAEDIRKALHAGGGARADEGGRCARGGRVARRRKFGCSSTASTSTSSRRTGRRGSGGRIRFETASTRSRCGHIVRRRWCWRSGWRATWRCSVGISTPS